MCSSQKRAKPVCFPILWQCLLPSLQRNSHRDRVTGVVWRSLPAVLWDSVKHTRLEFNGWVNVFFRCYVFYYPVFIYVQVNENCCVGTISEILKISKIYKWAKDGAKDVVCLGIWYPIKSRNMIVLQCLNFLNWRFLITFWRLCFATFTLNLTSTELNSTYFFASGSRPYPVMATPYADEQQISPVPPPTSAAMRQASPQVTGPNQRTSPRDSPQVRTAQERELQANKQIQKESIKRKHEENDRSNNAKKVKLQSTQKTDGPKEMLRKLEEARLKDKTDLPCEWPRVADGEFILENGEPKIWHCGQCDKSFAQRSLLQMHVCSRNPNRPYQCGHCAQEFAHPNELRTHAVIHSGKKPFKCGFCSRTFAGATTLNNHVRTHTGERPFTCNKCYKTFSQASQLSKHKRSLYECFSWEFFCREDPKNNFTLATIRLRGVVNIYISRYKKRLLCIL